MTDRCNALNPNRRSSWAWYCSLSRGHQGPHRAHHEHDEDARFEEWGLTDVDRRALSSAESEHGG